jgi:hypothetical protein
MHLRLMHEAPDRVPFFVWRAQCAGKGDGGLRNAPGYICVPFRQGSIRNYTFIREGSEWDDRTDKKNWPED